MDIYLVLVGLKETEDVEDNLIGNKSYTNLSNIIKLYVDSADKELDHPGITFANMGGNPNFLYNDMHSINNYAKKLVNVPHNKRYQLIIEPTLPIKIVNKYERNENQTNFSSSRLGTLVSIVDYEFKDKYHNQYNQLVDQSLVVFATGDVYIAYNPNLPHGEFLRPIKNVILKFINVLKYISEHRTDFANKRIKFIYRIDYDDEEGCDENIAYNHDKIIKELESALNNSTDYNTEYKTVRKPDKTPVDIKPAIKSAKDFAETNKNEQHIINLLLKKLLEEISLDAIPQDIKDDIDIVRVRNFDEVSREIWGVKVKDGVMQTDVSGKSSTDDASRVIKDENSNPSVLRRQSIGLDEAIKIIADWDNSRIKMLRLVIDKLELDGKWDEAIDTINIAIEETDNQHIETDLRYTLGKINHFKGENDKALKILFDIKQNLESNSENELKKLYIETLYAIGEIYRTKSDKSGDKNFKKFSEYVNKGHEVSEKIGDAVLSSVGKDNIGLVYRAGGNLDRAIQFHQDSLNMKEELKDISTVEKDLLKSYSLNNIAVCYELKCDYDNAIQYYNLAIELKKKCGDRRGMLMSKSSLGLIYGIYGMFNQAVKEIEEVLKINEEMGDNRGIAISYYSLGYIYLYKADFEKSAEYFEKAVKHKIKYGFHNVGVDYPLTVYCYVKMREYDKAFQYLIKIKEDNIEDKTYSMEKVSVAMIMADDSSGKYSSEIEQWYGLGKEPEVYFKKAIDEATLKHYYRGQFLALYEYGLYVKSFSNRAIEGDEKLNRAKELAGSKNMQAFLKYF
jgi:tetratricopeptide (TPR) repeat protein